MYQQGGPISDVLDSIATNGYGLPTTQREIQEVGQRAVQLSLLLGTECLS